MMNAEVNIKKLSDSAQMPTYGTPLSAGADLYAATENDIIIPAGKTVPIPTGIALEIPAGYVGLIFARSSLGTKRGLAPANKVGVIDADYRGEVMVMLYNHSDTEQKIAPKERIAQLVIVPYLKAEFRETDMLSDTARGSGGFGSTGK